VERWRLEGYKLPKGQRQYDCTAVQGVCAHCGESYTATNNRQLYCGRSCQRKAHRTAFGRFDRQEERVRVARGGERMPLPPTLDEPEFDPRKVDLDSLRVLPRSRP
jgi:hypothetical protein